MGKIILIGAGGFLGAVSRYGISQLVRLVVPHPFPIATLTINVLGSIGIGLLFEIFRNHHLLPTMTLFVGIGFLGSFTTFSAFSFETIDLFKRSEFHLALFNVVGNVLFCLGGVLLGEWLGRSLKI
jgi:CrcB protein